MFPCTWKSISVRGVKYKFPERGCEEGGEGERRLAFYFSTVRYRIESPSCYNYKVQVTFVV